MSTWHYQVMVRYDEFEERDMYGLYEYFPEVEGGKDVWSMEPIVEGESIEDLRNHLYIMIDDMDRFGVKEW